MNNKIPENSRKRHLALGVKAALREVSNQISLLNHQISSRVELRDVDLDCLDYISQNGPLGPSALARGVSLHPATMTGVLDRLERGGWIARDRDPADRRGVLVRIIPERNSDLLHLYEGMDAAMTAICTTYSESELSVIADFLTRSAEAGRVSTASMSVQDAG
jgi:DNA-binding MarR family transcriptional regulator